ncbi:MAG TPA: acyl-CoA dehydrogenase family protein [Actinomycetota bacterium]|jgi:alkylation response protein AidB-like acyl-CoA dehydrogenase|nr:acyl-CoA dehydrogenase family protein [Actinomycetota bacterium]
MLDYAQFDRAIGLNWYEVDPDLQDIIRRYVPADDFPAADARLREVGALIGGPVAERAEVTDRNPPRLERFDRWGAEVNRVVHHPGALATKRDLWESGRRHSANGRSYSVVGSASGYLLDQAETGMGCAVGMTGGVAGLVASYGSEDVKSYFMPHFTTDNYDEFWDGAMFLTERDGGSDLGGATKTKATHVDGDLWVLNGFKWFCSNVDAQAIATLARPEGAAEGTGGIALFVVPRVRRDGSPNGVHIHRLKDKLGTRAVPTGEVDFIDAEAYLLAGGSRSRDAGADGKGMGRMMGGMVQGSRLGVAFMGLGIARRSFLEAAIYAAHRRAWGNRIDAFPMVQETLVRMLMELEAAAAISFEASAANDSRNSGLWRILPTLAKYRATRRGVQLASAAIEIHGGNGYIEDWPLTRQLRDGQCHPIWEGTENVIAIDVVRAIEREGVLTPFLERVDQAVADADHPVVAPVRDTIRAYAAEVQEAVAYVAAAPKDVARLHPRRIARYMSNLMSAALLAEQGSAELNDKNSARKAALARLYANVHLGARRLGGIGQDDQIVLEGFDAITRYGELEPDRLGALVA